jgi:quercetin dioxygenase-like cupin family protein
MKIKKLSGKLMVITTLGCVILAGAVYAATTLILAVGTIPESGFFGDPATVTVRTLTIPPGEVGAWHYHPGYAFNVVKSGVLTVENGCGGGDENLTPGQAFEELEGDIHRAKNLGTEPVVVYNTFVMPQGKPTTINTTGNERLCGPPAKIDDCKLDGWRNFSHPQTFDDQGSCIKWVLQRPRTTIPMPLP